MKISIDMHHNPMRGTVDCTHCHAPIAHMSDSWHDMLASQAARACGETHDPHKGTPKARYPAMAEKAADMLAGTVTYYLFCHYCGKALQQPWRNPITNAPVLPKTFSNTHPGALRWVQELGLTDLPVDDYHKWQGMAREQREMGKVVWNDR